MKPIIFAMVLATTACNAKPAPHGLQIKLHTVYVADQDKALHFYTDVLGFVKKNDVSNGGYRWLTVSSPADPDGTELQLAPGHDAEHQPAAMFFTDDIQGDYERIKARGATFKMPPTPVTGSTIAQLDDGSGNVIQITQLAR